MAASSAGLGYQYARHLPLKPTSTEKSPYSWFRLPKISTDPVTPGTVCWGTTGDMPSPERLPGTDFSTKKQEHQEISRVEEPVRIENPDDPSQYIIVQRASELNFKVLTEGGYYKPPKPEPGNTDAEEPEGIEEYEPEQIESFKPVVINEPKESTLKVRLKNGPQSL